tara:strand:+ start:3621 stop:4811 length:1191 start_codon:yes stop_codon:yes gene_type:complete
LTGYFLLPAIIALPYFLSIYNISYLDCYFEAISGFTSTGFTIFNNIKHLDQSLLIWRSTSQWVGGIYFLFSIILLIDIFDTTLKKSFTEFISFNFVETLKQYFKILIIYSTLTLIIFFILILINLRVFDSFNLALSIISSGGFLPVEKIDSLFDTDLKKILFSLTMLISFFSLFLLFNIFFIKFNKPKFFIEDFYLMIFLIICVIIFFVFLNYDRNFVSNFTSLVTSISNIGFTFESNNANLYFIYIILVIIGGSLFSTSSGLRFFKLFNLIKFSLNDLLSHSKPNHIYTNKIIFSDTYIDQSEINKYFLSLLIFLLSLTLITSLLTIFNINFETAFVLGILTLMNTVNSSAYGLQDFNFFTLEFYSKFVLIIFMIIGRVELITLLILLKKFLFKN